MELPGEPLIKQVAPADDMVVSRAERAALRIGLVRRAAQSRWLRGLIRAAAVSAIVFVEAFMLIRLVPGDPALAILGDSATPEAVATLRSQLRLDRPLLEQLGLYVTGLTRGDLGTSLATYQPVTQVIANSLPVTLWLVAVTTVLMLSVAIPVGVLVALNRYGAIGHAFVLISSVLVATPVFFSSLVLLLVFAIALPLAPVGGYDPRFPTNLRYLILPAVSLCTVLVPVMARVVASSVAKTNEEEFVETAVVHGLRTRTRVWRYILRPSLAPTIALMSYILGEMVGSAVLVQLVFGLPGIGTELVNAVSFRDYPTVQGIVAFLGVSVVAITYVADTISAALDPRVGVSQA